MNHVSSISLHAAAQSLAGNTGDIHAFEVKLAHAIEHGELHANVKRWATEQWEGKQLPGNINRLETFISQDELQAWQARQAG